MGDTRQRRGRMLLVAAAATMFAVVLAGSAGAATPRLATPATTNATTHDPTAAQNASKQTRPQQAERTAEDGLLPAFDRAARAYDVPRSLLIALGYAETHLDGHNGEPSFARGYGVMHLVDNPTNQTLPLAAKLTGLSKQRLQQDSTANIDGAAAVLDRYAETRGLDASQRGDPGAWYPVVARYAHAANQQTARTYADTVYDHLTSGISIVTKRGDRLRLPASPDVQPRRGRYADTELTPRRAQDRAGYPAAIWNPADGSNYESADRGAGDISAVVVHTTQGSYAGSISWFQDPQADVSAHYVIRSNDGEITQMVDDSDIAWHARDGNPYSIGIEHEGYVDDPSWYTDAMYKSSAQVTAYACATYDFSCDREHVVGHSEVPGNDHTDPGPNWDWDYYMSLVNDAEPATYNFSTRGKGVNVRKGASLDTPVVTTVSGPTKVFVECQQRGDKVTANGESNVWWAKLRDQKGFMSQIYIDHKISPLPGVAMC